MLKELMAANFGGKAREPQMTPEQLAQGRAQWAELAPGVSFLRLQGLVLGLEATRNAPSTSAPELLGVPDDGALAEWIEIYADDVHGGLESGEVVPPEVFEEGRENVTEWMSGVGLAVGMDFQKYMGVMASPTELEEMVMAVMGFMSFAPRPFLSAELEDILKGQEHGRRLITTREGFLQTWDAEPESERRKVLHEMVPALATAFAISNHIVSDLNSKYGGGGFAGLTAEPIRREGRKIRPNEPCPCGSGKKYKKCHGAPGAAPLP